MRRRRLAAGLIFVVAMPAANPAAAAPANTIRELIDGFRSCFRLPEGEPGSELTLVFSLRRDGSLIGRPHVSYAKLPRDADEKNRFVENVANALLACTPAPITPELGGAIAGRPLSLRFVISRRDIKT
jgi:hypothetical protein